MEPLAVDAPRSTPKNGPVTVEELRVIGPKLRGMRVARGLRQSDVVKDGKAGGLKLGTLQAIEGAWYEVRDTNVDKYARFFDTTRDELRQSERAKAVAATDPRLKDLNDEHLEIARDYMRARTSTRVAIKFMLYIPTPAQERALTSLVEKLGPLPADKIGQIEAHVMTDPVIAQLLERIRVRCLTDPSYLEIMLKNDALEQQATDRLAAESAKPPKKVSPSGRRRS
jgi:hypothetical protein